MQGFTNQTQRAGFRALICLIFLLNGCSKVGDFFAGKCAGDNPNCLPPSVTIVSGGGKSDVSSSVSPGSSGTSIPLKNLRAGEETIIELTLTNPVLYPLKDFSAVITPANSGYTLIAGTEDEDCDQMLILLKSQSCRVRIAYNPIPGILPVNATCYLKFKSPKGVELVFTAPLTAPDLLADFTISDSAMQSFPDLLIYDVVTPADVMQELTFINYGEEDISNIDMSVSGSADFSIVAAGGGYCQSAGSLASQGTCRVKIQFKPVTAGIKRATLLMAGDAGISRSFTLSGTGHAISSSTTNLSFGFEQVADPEVTSLITITNPTATTVVTASNCVASYTGNADIRLTGVGTCVAGLASLASGASCTLEVGFTPTDPPSNHSGTLKIDCDARGGTINIPLSGASVLSSNFLADTNFVNFGDLLVGSTSDKTVTFSNEGSTDTETSFTRTVSTSVGGNFSQPTDTCGTSLAPAASCVTTLRFTPAAAGGSSAVFTGSASDVTYGTLTLPINVLGNGRTVTASVSTFDFGSVVVGADQPGTSITITNPSTTQTASGCTFSATTAATEIDLDTSTCAAATSLTAGASCSFTLRFTAGSSLGVKSATYTHSCSIGGSASVALSGTVVDDNRLVVSAPSTVDLGSRLVGITDSLTFTIRDDSETLSATGVSVTSGTPPTSWTESANTCGATLAPLSSCAITMAYAPLATPGSEETGASSSTVTVTSASTDLSDPTYGATAVKVTPSSSTYAFGNVFVGVPYTSAPITISNPSSIDDASTCAFTIGAPFTLAATDCTDSLGAGQSCFLTVNLPAPGAPGALSANADYVCTVGGRARIALSATVANPPDLAWSGTQAFTKDRNTTLDRTFTLTNNDASVATSNLSIVWVGGSSVKFTVQSTTCGLVLAPLASCTVVVRFAPTATGAVAGTLRAISSAAGISEDYALSGTGTQMTLTLVSNSSTPYVNREVGWATAATTVVTIRNDGDRTANLGTSFTLNPGTLFANAGTGTCAATLAAAATCTYNLTYSSAPAAENTLGTFRIRETEGQLNPNITDLNIAQDGTTIGAPVIQIMDNRTSTYANPLALSDITGSDPDANNIVDLTPATRDATYTVRNSGAATVNGATVALTHTSGTVARFAIRNDTCTAAVLAANATCTFDIRYTPSTNDQNTKQSFLVSTTSTVSASVFTAAITEVRGYSLIGATITFFSGTPLDYGSLISNLTANNDIAFVLKNTGTQIASGLSYADTGDTHSVYSVVTPAGSPCGATLAGGATCNLTLRFNASSKVGSFSGNVAVTGTQTATNVTSPIRGASVLQSTTTSTIDTGLEHAVASDSTRFYFVSRETFGTGMVPALVLCSKTSTGSVDTSTCTRANLPTALALAGNVWAANSKYAGDFVGGGPTIAVYDKKIVVALQNMDTTIGGVAGGNSSLMVCQIPATGNTISSCTNFVVYAADPSGNYPNIVLDAAYLYVGNNLANDQINVTACPYDPSTVASSTTMNPASCVLATVGAANQGSYLGMVKNGSKIILSSRDAVPGASNEQLRLTVCDVATTVVNNCTSSTAASGVLDGSGLLDIATGGTASRVASEGTTIYAVHTVTGNKSRLTLCTFSVGTNLLSACASGAVADTDETGYHPALAIGTSRIWVTSNTRIGATNATLQVWDCHKSTGVCTGSYYHTQASGAGRPNIHSRNVIFDSTNKILVVPYRKHESGGSREAGFVSLGLLSEL